MKSPRTALIASAIPLLLTSLPLTAAELPFNTPTTEQAKVSAPLLHQTARALHDAPGALQLRAGQRISNLWLFPTADAATVFARYDLTSSDDITSVATGSTTEHLAVLTVREDRIVESRELTSSGAAGVSNESAGLHWSATFGSGDAARTQLAQPNTRVTNTAHSPAPPLHWTASIGTGTAASSTARARETQQPATDSTQPVVAAAHWTSRIGTGHALDSTHRVM